MQAELRGVRDGTKLHERFRSGESVERAQILQRPFQYLYRDSADLIFMDVENFAQISVPRTSLAKREVFLQEGMQVSVEFHDEDVLDVILPETVTLEVSEADPVVKGQTAAASYKPARLSNGLRTMVPPHIRSGDKIVVSTADGSYSERAK